METICTSWGALESRIEMLVILAPPPAILGRPCTENPPPEAGIVAGVIVAPGAGAAENPTEYGGVPPVTAKLEVCAGQPPSAAV